MGDRPTVKIRHNNKIYTVSAGTMQFLSFRWYVKVLIDGKEWWFPVLSDNEATTGE